MIKNTICFFYVWLLVSCNPTANSSSIKVVGQMSDVMWKGELKGNIATDSLEGAKTYGLGPLAFLKGEIVLFEGQTFVSKVIDSSSHKVSNVPSVKAPFFVYSTDSDLEVIEFKPNNYSLKELEQQIDSIYGHYDQPLLLRIDGVFDALKLHSVDLPQGAKVSSPEQAHLGLTEYNFNSISGSLIGFFSRHHKAVFTHHDSFLHAHFISQDREVLGHIDALNFHSSRVSPQISK
jgi:acetolactate decarboxylase